MVFSVVQLHVKVYIYVSVFRSSWRPVFQNTQIGQPNSHQEHFAIVGYPLPNMCGAPVPSRMSKGSHGIQERLPVDTSKSITFGNETAGTGDTTVMSKVSASFPNEKALTVSQAGSVLAPAGRGGEGVDVESSMYWRPGLSLSLATTTPTTSKCTPVFRA